MMKHTTPRMRIIGPMLLAAMAALSGNTLHAQEYCVPDGFDLGVEPICRLIFADIDNSSPGTSDAPFYEDFTSMVAHLEAGATYSVTASGYTGATPPDHLAANFDWDGDYTFETHVELADIVGDNCDTETTGSFTVPVDAVVGASRVRFVKTFSYNADDDGCAWGSSYGQSEDYTVQVAPFTGIREYAGRPFTVSPNPGNGDITLVNSGTGMSVDVIVLDLSGRTVHSERIASAPGTSFRMALSSVLSTGTYTALVNSGGVKAAARFIVQ